MTRAFIYSLLALAAGAGLYILLGDDPGYVLISIGNWSIESTLVALVLFLLVVLVLIYGLYRLVGLLNPAGLFRGNAWFGASRKRKNAAAASEEGLRLLLLGHWQDAYKLLVENARHSENPVFNYLAAGFAAWQRADNSSWNYCMEQASKHARQPIAGIGSVKALLELRAGKVEQSLAILLTLDKQAPGSPFVLTMLKDIYVSVQDWEKLALLIPELEKHKVITATEMNALREKITGQGLLAVTPENGGLEALQRKWHDSDKKIRRSEAITMIYLEKLITFSRHDDALQIASNFLKHQWSEKIVLLVGYIQTTDSGKVLVLLEKWLKARPNNSALMLSLGRASLRNNLWGKAREYFESTLRLSKSDSISAEANAELARLLDALGEHSKSTGLYEKAMAQLNHKLPELPLP